MFTPTDLRRVVDETFVRLVDYHDELPSTNDRALRILPEWQEKLPALIVAGQQTAGRGRNQNKWWAAPGALTFWLLAASIKQANLPSPWPALSMWTAIALRNVRRYRASVYAAEGRLGPRKCGMPCPGKGEKLHWTGL